MKKISFALFFCLCALAGFAQNSKPLDLKEIGALSGFQDIRKDQSAL